MTTKENFGPDVETDSSIFEQGGLCLRGAKAERIRNALYEISSAIESLNASVPLFASTALGLHEIDHRYAVESFAKYVDRRMALLMSSVVNEDPIDHPLSVTNTGAQS